MKYNDSYLDIPKVIVKVAFSSVPIVGSAVTELINYLDTKFFKND